MVRYHYQTRRDAERQYPYRVDIPVPPNGFGNALNQVVEWCRQRFTEWEHHGPALEERDARGIKIDAVTDRTGQCADIIGQRVDAAACAAGSESEPSAPDSMTALSATARQQQLGHHIRFIDRHTIFHMFIGDQPHARAPSETA